MFRMSVKSALVLLTIVIVAVMFLPWAAHAQQGSVAVKFQIKYLGFDNYNNGFRMHVNVSTSAPGHLTYMEEYYTLDSDSNPKYVASKSFDGGDLVKVNKSYNASFEILRPTGSYKLVKSVFLLDGSRIFEYWLTKNRDFIDNTPAADDGEDALLSGIRNIDRFEVREKVIFPDTAVAFNYTTLGDISEVDVTGAGKDDISLKVELLKGRDSLTANPGVPVYRYFNIRSDSVHIQNISVEYRVQNAWITKNISVRLASWDSGSKIWRVIPTNVAGNDSEYTYFKSRSAVLPYFAIIGLPVQKSKAPAVTMKAKNDTVKETPSAGVLPAMKGVPGFDYLTAFIALIMIFRINRRK